MYPEADIPAIQLSLVRGLEPVVHIETGKALHEIMNEKILVIGSGFSFHNMGAFLRDVNICKDQANDLFQEWLIETCTALQMQEKRERRLIHWEKASAVRY
jgi:aromatic ring-opening dioxygenase catalytic subunit (LigB family)